MSTSNVHQQSLDDAGSETRPSMLEREAPRMQKEEDLRGDDWKQYKAEIKAMNLILISIPNDIYNSYVTQVNLAKRLTEDYYDDLFDYLQQFKMVNASRAKKLEKSHNPLALVAHTGSSSRTSSPYYVTHPPLVVDYDDDYQRDTIQNNPDDPLTSAMILLARAILETSLIQQIIKYKTNCCKCSMLHYNEKVHYARNCLKLRIRDSKYFMEQMLLAKQDEAGFILTDEQIEELSANICLMARIQPANIDGPSNDYAFLSQVQTSSTSYVNSLFAKDTKEQKYPTQPKIINQSIGDDQIDSNIIFDEPNEDVNSGSVEHDNNVQDSYKFEQLARNAYKEAEKQQIIAKKVQQQNIMLPKQLELYKEKIRVFEITKEKTTTYFNEYIEAERKAKRFEQEPQSQFIRDRDIIRDLEQQHDKLDLKNVDTMLKIGNSLQGMFMIGPKPMSFYDSKLKHGLGYANPYTLKKAISQNPKLYDASCLDDSKIHMNVRDTEDILEDATKSQIKMKNKMKDLVAIQKKQNVCTIDYNKLNALYDDFVPQKELSDEQKYFPSSFISSEDPLNESSPYSSSETKPTKK
ncbi:hypothetical protein Tco_1113295 [Tanacetum coccineum]|uniref:Gag-Pol polyprotein n=1 Tax=Tanacetum coccineum TaxID=301880 RepID=A0ABQ5IU35_9ASTR